MASRKQQLGELADDIETCTLCPLQESRTHAVPGEGGIRVDAMIVGEAPGKEEDESGRPFVGAAGRYLDHVLDEVGLSRSDFFITNLVKCRPPKNRDPRASEIDTCTSAYLQQQIELVQPKVVVLLGASAAGAMLDDFDGIKGARGTTIEQRGQKFVVTYHPASRFHRDDLGEKIREDFRRLKRVLAQL